MCIRKKINLKLKKITNFFKKLPIFPTCQTRMKWTLFALLIDFTLIFTILTSLIILLKKKWHKIFPNWYFLSIVLKTLTFFFYVVHKNFLLINNPIKVFIRLIVSIAIIVQTMLLKQKVFMTMKRLRNRNYELGCK